MVTEKQTRSRPSVASKPKTPGRPAKAARPMHKLRIQRVSLSSLLRVALIFYVGLVIVGLIATIVAWGVFNSIGLVTKVNHLIDQLVGSTNYNLSLGQVLVIQLGLGVVWAIVTTVVTFVAGALYNLASEMGNGISIGVVDDSK